MPLLRMDLPTRWFSVLLVTHVVLSRFALWLWMALFHGWLLQHTVVVLNRLGLWLRLAPFHDQT